MSENGKLLVVDGHSLAFRAFFALPVESFTTSNAQATNAVYGFITMLADVMKKERPTHLGIAFDVAGGTFRNTMLPQYKGTRDAAPEDLISQIPLIQRLLRALGVRYIEMPGFEGDDIIGTMATMGESAGLDVLVLSGDRDAFQLIDDSITVLYPGHHFKDLKAMTPQAVVEKYGVTPQQYPDLAALRGETADNIPGVVGVGDGYAAKWIGQFGGLEQIIEHADEIPGKKGEALRESLEQVKLNRKVNALVRDLDLPVKIDDLTMCELNIGELDEILDELEFGSRTRKTILDNFGLDLPQVVASVTRGTKSSPQSAAHAGSSATFATDRDGLSDEAVAVPQLIIDNVDSSSVRQWLEDSASSDTSEQSEQGNRSEQSNKESSRRFTLLLEGDAKPGRAELERVSVANAHSHAISFAYSSATHEAFEAIVDFFKQPNHLYTTYGYKAELHLAHSAGLRLPCARFDTKLAAYIVSPDKNFWNLDEVGDYFLNGELEPHTVEKSTDESENDSLQGLLDIDGSITKSEGELQRLSVHKLAQIAKLTDILSGLLDARGQSDLLTQIEIPVSSTLFEMECAGAAVDKKKLVDFRERFGADAEQASRIAFDAAGYEFNLQSPKQLQKVLFDDLGLTGTRKTKTGYTTDATALQELYIRSVHNERANNFLGALLRFREMNKLKQIAQTLIDSVNSADSRIHTTFEQTVAGTGRLSSTDPNLQNIPNRNALGREIRGVFIAGEGFTDLLSSDYSQVELRIMAHLSGDEALIEAFKSGVDFHKYVASLVYQIPVDEVSGDQRSHVKAMSYGLAYGLSTYGLAQRLEISPAEADVLKNKYFETFGKVHDYLESLQTEAAKRGYTETMFGRRRYFPGFRSPVRRVKDAAARAALNAPIQGSAADIMKIAMVKAHQALCEARVKSRVILQIHDELVVELATGEEEQVTEIVKNAMEHAVELSVPLDVSTGIGTDWQLAAH
jgi:DNA polymerase-1